MSISRQNLTVVIVTLRSEKVIDQCIESINQDLPIIVVENSENFKFKIPKNLPPISSIISGYFSYDIIRYIEKIPNKNKDDLSLRFLAFFLKEH